MGSATTLSFGFCSLSACLRCWTMGDGGYGGVVMFGVAGVTNMMLGIFLFLVAKKERSSASKLLEENGPQPTFMI